MARASQDQYPSCGRQKFFEGILSISDDTCEEDNELSDSDEDKDFVDFCDDCGAILPPPIGVSPDMTVACVICDLPKEISHFDDIYASSVIYFNNVEDLLAKDRQMNKGPTVERQCRKCPSEKMYYFTLQTRSADEGQTVFYTCCGCGAQENENS